MNKLRLFTKNVKKLKRLSGNEGSRSRQKASRSPRFTDILSKNLYNVEFLRQKFQIRNQKPFAIEPLLALNSSLRVRSRSQVIPRRNCKTGEGYENLGISQSTGISLASQNVESTCCVKRKDMCVNSSTSDSGSAISRERADHSQRATQSRHRTHRCMTSRCVQGALHVFRILLFAKTGALWKHNTLRQPRVTFWCWLLLLAVFSQTCATQHLIQNPSTSTKSIIHSANIDDNQSIGGEKRATMKGGIIDKGDTLPREERRKRSLGEIERQFDFVPNPVHITIFAAQLQNGNSYHDVFRVFGANLTDEQIDRWLVAPQHGPPFSSPLGRRGRIGNSHARHQGPSASDLISARQHLQEMQNRWSCSEPVPQVIRMKDYAEDGVVFQPSCTVVYKCSTESGCCDPDSECIAHSEDTIQRHFFVLRPDPEHRGYIPARQMVRTIHFTNHTECRCRQKQGLSECLQCPEPEVFTASRVDRKCVCDCNMEERLCKKLKRGQRRFTEEQAVCISEGRCHVPQCKFGEYSESEMSCPLSRRRNSQRRRAYG